MPNVKQQYLTHIHCSSFNLKKHKRGAGDCQVWGGSAFLEQLTGHRTCGWSRSISLICSSTTTGISKATHTNSFSLSHGTWFSISSKAKRRNCTIVKHFNYCFQEQTFNFFLTPQPPPPSPATSPLSSTTHLCLISERFSFQVFSHSTTITTITINITIVINNTPRRDICTVVFSLVSSLHNHHHHH